LDAAEEGCDRLSDIIARLFDLAFADAVPILHAVEGREVVTARAWLESLLMDGMPPRDGKLPVKPRHRRCQHFRFRHCFAAAEGRDDLEAEDLIDDAGAPTTDALQLAEKIRFAPRLVLRPRVREMLLEKPLPLAAVEYLCGRDGPNHQRSFRWFRDRRNIK
jgi:hypothetical protein